MSLLPKFKAHASLFSTLTNSDFERLDQHFSLLLEWNERIALVSRKSVGESFAPHYVDSVLTVLKTKPLCPQGPFFDVGSGAGFPGLIFAILYPESKITLYEKSLKKQMFLNVVIQQMGLSNATVLGLLDTEMLTGLVYARAVFQEDRFFKFFQKCLEPETLLVRNLGSMSDGIYPNYFQEVLKDQYELPEGYGSRKIQVLKYVPRGT